MHVKMGKNLAVSALRFVEKLTTDILEYGAKSAFLLKPKNLKTRHSKEKNINMTKKD